MLKTALVRMLWRSIADDAMCVCCKNDPCTECEAMRALGLGRWRGAEHATRSLPSLDPRRAKP